MLSINDKRESDWTTVEQSVDITVASLPLSFSLPLPPTQTTRSDRTSIEWWHKDTRSQRNPNFSIHSASTQLGLNTTRPPHKATLTLRLSTTAAILDFCLVISSSSCLMSAILSRFSVLSCARVAVRWCSIFSCIGARWSSRSASASPDGRLYRRADVD